MRRLPRPVAIVALAVLCAGLAACGGGAGPRPHGSSSAPASPPTPTSPGTPTSSPTTGMSPSSSPSGPPGRTFGFVVVGDFGVGGEAEAVVARAARSWARSHPFDAFVTTGDNVYESGDPAAFDAAWTEPYGWVLDARVPVVATLGNHDVLTDGGNPEVGLFGIPGPVYSQRVGPVEFFVLNANDALDPAQTSFLRLRLSESTARWKVAVFHQPAVSCGFHKSTPEVQRAWVSMFERFGVQLVLNGHDHDYQRFGPINGVTYVVDGMGGADLYAVDGCPAGTPAPVTLDDQHHGFVYLEATRDSLRVVAVSDTGQILDRAEA
jgi:3',5'-cyclic AMP phosphodiesterase CpdA